MITIEYAELLVGPRAESLPKIRETQPLRQLWYRHLKLHVQCTTMVGIHSEAYYDD